MASNVLEILVTNFLIFSGNSVPGFVFSKSSMEGLCVIDNILILKIHINC